MPLRTPLYDWHVARGGHLVEFGGWDMPIRYGTIIDEHTAVRTAAGLFDISHMGRLVFEGPDALNFLQHVYTNDAATMKPGQVRYGLVCNEAGGILDDVLVYRLEPFWLMVVNASNRLKILDAFERQRKAFDVTITDRTADWAMVAYQGPKAAGTHLHPSAGPLKYYFAETHPSADGPLILSRTGYTGEDGYELILPAGGVVRLCDALVAATGVVPCGLGCRDTLRLEAAMPLYGHELSEQIDPYQAGLDWAVKLDKGPFVGRDALRRRQADANRPVRVGLELEGRRIAREGAAVLAGGAAVGTVTSGTFGPTVQKAIAMAYVPPAYAAAGTALEVDVRGRAEKARVVPLPFYKRAK